MLMRPLLLCLSLFATTAQGETCATVPDRTAELVPLMHALPGAVNERDARLITNQMWEIWAKAPDSYAQELLDEGMQRRSSFDFDGAITAFSALIDYCPGYAEGWNQRAFIYFLRERYEEALSDLDTALDLSPGHIAAMAGRALTLIRMERHEDGQAALRDALAINPWLPERAYLTD